MSYNEKTQNYKLPQWRADDKPGRQDFNEAFANVDAALANKVNKRTIEVFDLPLVVGYTGEAKYGKDVAGNVYVWINYVKKTDGSTLSDGQIGTLPEGYRPAILNYIVGQAVFFSAAGAQQNVIVRLQASRGSGLITTYSAGITSDCKQVSGFLYIPMVDET